MVEVWAVFCYCLLWPRDNRYMYMAQVCFYVCCSDCVGVCGIVCYIAVVVKVCCMVV